MFSWTIVVSTSTSRRSVSSSLCSDLLLMHATFFSPCQSCTTRTFSTKRGDDHHRTRAVGVQILVALGATRRRLLHDVMEAEAEAGIFSSTWLTWISGRASDRDSVMTTETGIETGTVVVEVVAAAAPGTTGEVETSTLEMMGDGEMMTMTGGETIEGVTGMTAVEEGGKDHEVLPGTAIDRKCLNVRRKCGRVLKMTSASRIYCILTAALSI